MTRSFYSSAIFFSGLYIVIAIFQIVIFNWLGAQIPELQSLAGWSLLEFLVGLIWSLILLKYYHSQQYRLAFWAMIVLITVSLLHAILLSNLMKTSEYTDHYIFAILALFGAGMLHGVSLVFSKTGKRLWLKAAGIILCLFNLIMFLSTIWAFNSLTVLHDGTIAKIQQWVSPIGSLVPILFIMNFKNEWTTAEKAYSSRQKSITGVMDFVTFIALVATLFLGYKVAMESIELSGNPNRVNRYEEELAQPFEARNYVNDEGETLPYRLLKPLNYDSTKKYPLVVCLHGTSGRGTDNVKQVSRSLMAQLLSTRENRKKYPAFLFVPQCPPEADWGGITNIRSVDSLVLGSISALEKEFAIDTSRRYVTGISMGGYGAWHLICSRPDMFAAAIPIAGAGDPALAQKVIGVPIWAFHGANDRNVLVRGSRDMIEAIKKQGGDPRYTEFPDKAHHISAEVKSTPGLLNWLFAQKRSPMP